MMYDIVWEELDLTAPADLNKIRELVEISLLLNHNSMENIFHAILRTYKDILHSLSLNTNNEDNVNIQFTSLDNLDKWLSYLIATVPPLKMKLGTQHTIEECQNFAFLNFVLSNFMQHVRSLYEIGTEIESQAYTLLENGILILTLANGFSFCRQIEDILVSAYIEADAKTKRKYGTYLSGLVTGTSRHRFFACFPPSNEEAAVDCGVLYQKVFPCWKKTFEQNLSNMKVYLASEDILKRLPQTIINYPKMKQRESTNNLLLAKERDKKGLYRKKTLQVFNKRIKDKEMFETEKTEIENVLSPDWEPSELVLRTREEKVLYLLYRWHRNSHSAGSHRRIDISFPDLLYMLRNTRNDVDDSPKELKEDIIDKKDVCLTVDQNIEEVNKKQDGVPSLRESVEFAIKNEDQWKTTSDATEVFHSSVSTTSQTGDIPIQSQIEIEEKVSIQSEDCSSSSVCRKVESVSNLPRDESEVNIPTLRLDSVHSQVTTLSSLSSLSPVTEGMSGLSPVAEVRSGLPSVTEVRSELSPLSEVRSDIMPLFSWDQYNERTTDQIMLLKQNTGENKEVVYNDKAKSNEDIFLFSLQCQKKVSDEIKEKESPEDKEKRISEKLESIREIRIAERKRKLEYFRREEIKKLEKLNREFCKMKKNLENNMQRRYKYNEIEAKLYQPINEKTIRKKNVSIQVKIPHKESEENISKNQKVLTKETGTHTEMRGVQADPTNNGGTKNPPTTEKNVKANIAEQTRIAEQNTIDIQTSRDEQNRIDVETRRDEQNTIDIQIGRAEQNTIDIQTSRDEQNRIDIQTRRDEQNRIDIQTRRDEQKRIETNHYPNYKAEEELETELMNKENEVKIDTKNMNEEAPMEEIGSPIDVLIEPESDKSSSENVEQIEKEPDTTGAQSEMEVDEHDEVPSMRESVEDDIENNSENVDNGTQDEDLRVITRSCLQDEREVPPRKDEKRNSEPQSRTYFDTILEYSRKDPICRRLETLELLSDSFEADFSQTVSLLSTIDKISQTVEPPTVTDRVSGLETIPECDESQ